MKTIALVIRSGPSASLGTREMIDMALVLATFECPVSIVLQDAGVYWAALPSMPEESPLSLSGKIKSLPLYDIDTILVDQACCEARNIQIADSFPGNVVDREIITKCLQTTHVILDA